MPHFNFEINVYTAALFFIGILWTLRDRFTLVEQLKERQQKFEDVVKELTQTINDLTVALAELRVEFHTYKENKKG